MARSSLQELVRGLNPGATFPTIAAEDLGLTVRIVELSGIRWTTISECNVWRGASPGWVANDSAMAKSVKFGQPSLLRLDSGKILATHWAVQDGQERIRTHRRRVEP